MINKIVGWFIRAMAKRSGMDPVCWLVKWSVSAELDQEQFNKLVGVL